MNTADLPPLALIAGPTASGKSALALTLAERTGGIIVNADSMQVYRDLRVLTARPSAVEEARASHRLFGNVDGAEACNAAAWADAARAVLADAWAARQLPILVGGTGLYLRTLLEGIAPVPAIDPALRAAVRALSVAEAYAALQREDAAAAAHLSPNDGARVARALEIVRATGRSLAYWQQQRSGGIAAQVRLHALILTPPSDVLAQRIDARATAMLPDALVEVAALARRALPPTLPVMRALGVRPLLAHLRDELDAQEALTRLQVETRAYAKRQRTWFRHQAPAQWVRAIDTESAKAWLNATASVIK